MDNKKQKKQGLKDSKRSLGYPLAQSISLDKKDTVSYEMIPGKTTMENIGTKADGTPNMVPSTSYSKRVISNKDYANRMGDRVDRFKSPSKFINPQVDPVTGQMIQPQPVPNRAGVPDRSLNSMQQMGTIVDPGMQSAQQAQAFQKFNSIAQNMPPSPTQMKSPVNNYADPGTAQTIDNSLGEAVSVLDSQREALMSDDDEEIEEDADKKKLDKAKEKYKKDMKNSAKAYKKNQKQIKKGKGIRPAFQ